MEHLDKKKAALTGIDAVYLPVTDKEKASAWYVEHFGLVIEGDHLLAGKQEIFLIESREHRPLRFETNVWLKEEERFEMPVICFHSSDIAQHYEYAVEKRIHVEELYDRGWFWEFDFYDCDGNKLKVWQPKG